MIPGAEKDDVEGEYNPRHRKGNVLVFTATDKESDKAVVLTTQNLMYTDECNESSLLLQRA